MEAAAGGDVDEVVVAAEEEVVEDGEQAVLPVAERRTHSGVLAAAAEGG